MNPKQSFGETIRALRKQHNEPLRVVAAAVEMDSTLLSKIERGERFPTEAQIAKFAKYFGIRQDELLAQVIADKIVTQYGHHATTLQAVKIVKERVSPYIKE
jgi:transcriptional regulator with XRE-family HTH domain